MAAVQATERPRLPLWVVVAAGGTIAALSLGVRSTFGLLVVPITDGLNTELGAISLAIAVQNLIWGFSQPVAGALSDRFGAVPVLAGGGALYVVAMALMSTAESSGMILLSGGFLIGIAIGAASFSVVLSAVGRMTPPEKRSMMLGVVSAIGSLGQFVLIPAARWLLARGTWESTSLTLALILVPIIFIAPMMRAIKLTSDGPTQTTATDPAPQSLRADLSKAIRSRAYLLLNAAFFVCGFHVTFIGIHLAGFVESEALSASVAATALALIGLFNVFGSLLVGWLGQRFAFTKLLAGIYGLRAVLIAVYMILPITATSTILFAMGFGVLWLSTVPPTGAMVTQQFGPTNSGALFGVVFLSHQLGSFIGAWLGGTLVDSTGSYQVMWWLSVALGVFAMAMHLLIDARPLPDKPSDSGGMRLAPAALVAVVLSLWAVLGVRSVNEAAALTSSTEPAPAFYCTLGPNNTG